MSIDLDQFEGMAIRDAAVILGKPAGAAKAWLIQRGYRCPGQIVRRCRSAQERQDEIERRRSASLPSSPCFLCGAARGCEHERPTQPARTLGGIGSALL